MRLQRCRVDGGFTWEDVGANGRRDFASNCKRDWEDVNGDLTSRQLELALDVCADGRDILNDLTCDDIVADFVP